ncbi:MAG: hypothetical protein P8X74_16600 [Reinekea sp.]|jgi:MSHA biogenesis protein MshI
MNVINKKSFSKQQWLYASDNQLIIFDTSWSKEGLPCFNVIATLNANNAFQNASTHADWVAKHISGKLNILIANSLFQLLMIDVPNVPPEEIDDAINLKAADLIPYDLEEAALDLIHLPSEAHRGRMRMAYLIATQKQPLSHWLEELIQRGIQVEIIDVEITQLRNLAVYHQTLNQSGILHLQPNQSRLLLNFNGEMVLNRVFDTGLQKLTDNQTVLDGELEVTVDSNQHQNIPFESLVLEIRRSFDYYESQLALGAISEIYVLCDEKYQSLCTSLANKLGVRFHLMRPQDFMQINTAETDSNPVAHYNLIGTLYREALQ